MCSINIRSIMRNFVKSVEPELKATSGGRESRRKPN